MNRFTKWLSIKIGILVPLMAVRASACVCARVRACRCSDRFCMRTAVLRSQLRVCARATRAFVRLSSCAHSSNYAASKKPYSAMRDNSIFFFFFCSN